MSREIKFRGLGILTGKWREGLLITNKLGSYIVIEENPHECTLHGYLEIDEYERVYSDTVGQYTGLKDKNGIEIYEYSELDSAYEVIFKDLKYNLRHILNNDIIDLHDYWRDKNGEIEVTREYTKV